MTYKSSSQNNLDLLGFDVKSAMALLGDNEELYITVLQRFYEEYSLMPEKLVNLSLVSEKEELQRIAHTIKGLAATIGANELHKKAKATEYAIREGKEPMLISMGDALRDSLLKIEDYFFDSKSNSKTVKPVQKYSIKDLLDELAKGRFIPDQELKKFELILISTLDTSSMTKTIEAIQTLDYPGAIQILRRFPN